jgi:hypothetical protein
MRWERLGGAKKGTVATMATEKDIAFAVYLLKLSREGKLKWEATARANEFTASLMGKYNVLVTREGSFGQVRYEHDPDYSLRLIDNGEQELLRLTENEYADLVQLFELARRASLKVDAVIDEILRGEGEDLPL